MKSVDWYKKVLIEKKNEILGSVFFGFIVVGLTAIWYWWIGKEFEWQKLELISQPSLLFRLFYSALVYISFGAFLYKIKFYQWLSNIFVVFLGDKRFYNDIKKIIWRGLILVMYFFIVPVVVDLLNGLITLIYNLLLYCLYISPLVFVVLLIFSIFIFLKKY